MFPSKFSTGRRTFCPVIYEEKFPYLSCNFRLIRSYINFHTITEKSFRNLIKSTRNPIVFTKWTKLLFAWFQVNRKMINTIWFRFDLIRKDFSEFISIIRCRIFYENRSLSFFFHREYHCIFHTIWKFGHFSNKNFNINLKTIAYKQLLERMASLGNDEYQIEDLPPHSLKPQHNGIEGFKRNITALWYRGV